MNFIIKLLILNLSLLNLSYSDTWDHCNSLLNNNFKINFSTYPHYSRQTKILSKLNVTYSNYQDSSYHDYIKSYKNDLIIYKSDSHKIIIESNNCSYDEDNNFFCVGQFQNIKIKSLPKTIQKLKCKIYIPYTPATGSGGRCNGRRC